jgi:hypothetical protein
VEERDILRVRVVIADCDVERQVTNPLRNRRIPARDGSGHNA